MDKIIRIDSVDQFNHLFGVETLHPLVSVVDMAQTRCGVNHAQMNYGIYALYLKENKSCDITYGRQKYDYDEGTIVCFAPGQVVGVDMPDDAATPKGMGLLFHPDLLKGTSLGRSIGDYTFFSYAVREALHLSDSERATVIDCMHKISDELSRAIDKHSQRLIAMNIELLLGYCMRFYERQFTSRHELNRDVLVQFERLLDDYFAAGLPESEGLPSVRYFADKVCLSANYFGDLIKKETGRTAIEHIQSKLIDVAKEYILGSDRTMSQISYDLGFQYPQHFGRLFKKLVGCTPNEFRNRTSVRS